MSEQATVEVTANGTENGNGKRAYTKRDFCKFDDPVELLALYAILRGDSNVHSGWRSHILQKVESFIPQAVDLSKPPVHPAVKRS